MEETSPLPDRRDAARRIIEGAHRYYTERANVKHTGIDTEWIERVLTNPHRVEVESNGRIRYWGYIPEWGEEGRWLRVVVDNGKLFNAFPDRNKLNLWGIP